MEVAGCLSEAARQELESMYTGKYEYISDFARRYFGQGRAEGRAEGKAEGEILGRAEVTLRQLSVRFGVLSEEAQSRIRSANLPELDALAERVLSAGTLSEALGELG
jgi:hypothetical protein